MIPTTQHKYGIILLIIRSSRKRSRRRVDPSGKRVLKHFITESTVCAYIYCLQEIFLVNMNYVFYPTIYGMRSKMLAEDLDSMAVMFLIKKRVKDYYGIIREWYRASHKLGNPTKEMADAYPEFNSIMVTVSRFIGNTTVGILQSLCVVHYIYRKLSADNEHISKQTLIDSLPSLAKVTRKNIDNAIKELTSCGMVVLED